MTPELSELLENLKRLTPTTRAFMARLVRKIVDGYEGEIDITVKRGGISQIKWTQLDDGRSVQDGG